MFDNDYGTLVADSAPTEAGTALWQGSLFGSVQAAVDPALTGRTRRVLDQRSWLDVAPGWLDGADSVFAALHGGLRWRRPEVTMYERRVPQPRLSSWYRIDDGDTDDDPRRVAPVLEDVRSALSSVYDVEFDSIGSNLYRDGNDSVAWHGDRHARTQRDPVVAIVVVGSSRPFLVRPKAGGRSTRLVLHAGDLLVMGGACQHDWEHSVPKVRRSGPRISITFRHSG